MLTNLTIVPSFSFKQWQACPSHSSISTPIFLKTSHTVSSRTLLSTEFGRATISRVSRWKSLNKSVINSPNDSNSCFQLFKMSYRVFLISFDRSAICVPRVASAFRNSYTNSGLVSLFSTAFVLVPLNVIRMLQYQIIK